MARLRARNDQLGSRTGLFTRCGATVIGDAAELRVAAGLAAGDVERLATLATLRIPAKGVVPVLGAASEGAECRDSDASMRAH